MKENNSNRVSRATISPELAARAKNGDQAAFAELYELTNAELYRSIRAMVRDEDLAWDILQDTYLRAFRSIDKLEHNEAILSWLRRIAANVTASHMTKRLPMTFTDLAGEDEDEQPELPDLRVEAQPEQAMDRQETSRLVREIIGGLPEVQQLVLGMRYYEELSVKEISELLELPTGTVKTQLHRGRKRVETAVRDLEKQGVKLYGLSPIAFLVHLLRQLEPAKEAERQVLRAVLSKTAAAGSKALSGSAAGSAAKAGASAGSAALSGSAAGSAIGVSVTSLSPLKALLGGAVGRLLAAGLVVAMLGGGVWVCNRLLSGPEPEVGVYQPSDTVALGSTEDPERLAVRSPTETVLSQETQSEPEPAEQMHSEASTEPKPSDATEPATTEPEETEPTEPETRPLLGETNPIEPLPTLQTSVKAFLDELGREWCTETIVSDIWAGRSLTFYEDGSLYYREGKMFSEYVVSLDGCWKTEGEDSLLLTLWTSPYTPWDRPEDYVIDTADPADDAYEASFTCRLREGRLILTQNTERGFSQEDRAGKRLIFHDSEVEYPIILEEELRAMLEEDAAELEQLRDEYGVEPVDYVGWTRIGGVGKAGLYVTLIRRTHALTVSEEALKQAQETGFLVLQDQLYRYFTEEELAERNDGAFPSAGYGSIITVEDDRVNGLYKWLEALDALNSFSVEDEMLSPPYYWVEKLGDRYYFVWEIGGVSTRLEEETETCWVMLDPDTPLEIGPGAVNEDAPRTLEEYGVISDSAICYPYIDEDSGELRVYLDLR